MTSAQQRRTASSLQRRSGAAGLSTKVIGCAGAVLLVFALGVPEGPSWAQAANGVVYTANEHGASLSAIDLSSGQVTTTPIPIAPHNIQLSSDGSRLLAVGEPAAEAHGHGENDDTHGTASEAAAGGQLVVLDPEKPDAGPLAGIPVGAHPAHVVTDQEGARAFVTDAGDNTLVVVDLASGKVLKRITTGRYPHGLRISPNGREAYVAAVEDNAVSVIDTTELAEVARIAVGKAPVQVGFTPDGARVYVSLRDENSVAVIDAGTRKVVSHVAVGRNPIQVHATPDGARVYVANQGSEANPDNTVSVIDTATNTVIDTIVAGAGAHGVAVSADGTRVFVTNIIDDSVSVIDEATRTVVATYKVGDGPNGVTFRAR